MSRLLSVFHLFSWITVLMAKKSYFAYMNVMPEADAFTLTGDCVVTGDQLFANELFVRTLTSQEQSQAQQYQTELQQVQQQYHQLTDQLRNLSTSMSTSSSSGGNSRMRGRGGGRGGMGARGTPSPQAQAIIEELRNLTSPSTPSFCNGSDTILYVFEGCVVQNNKVYIGMTFVRNLTDTEAQQLTTFAAQAEAFEQWEMQQMEEHWGGRGGRRGGGRGGQSNNGTSTTTSPSSNPIKPPFPIVPQFCIAF